MRKSLSLGLIGLALILACSTTNQAVKPADTNTLENPAKAGAEVTYIGGSLKVLQVHRPTAFLVVGADITTGAADDMPAKAAIGAEFISIELEFTCGADQTVCEDPPEAILELALSDGRVVEENSIPMDTTWMGDDEISSGVTVTGWVTFEVPVGVKIDALVISPFEDDSSFYAALPSPVDGYSIDFPWETYDGFEERPLPALRLDLENSGFSLSWAGLYRDEEGTGLFATVYTDDLFYIDDAAAIEAAEAILLEMTALWDTYGENADYIGVELWNTLTDSVVATVGAELSEIDDYLNGTIDLATFMQYWWVVLE
ncbi:MAG: hypothetical protein OEZ02_01540 [Anaerolineae bacterium]|nr:hypothetical protein [Anaerolineae bacterium]